MRDILRRYWGLRPWQKHSQVLMVAGLVYGTIGLLYILTEAPASRRQALVLAYYWFSPEFWGYIFVTAAALSILSARWPPFAETWGYTVLTALSAGWSATYLGGVLFFGSSAANLTGFLMWGLLAFMWWAVSGLMNPESKVVIVGDSS